MVYTVAKTDSGTLFVCQGEPKFEGIGNCCGWYSSEKYVNCDVVGRIRETNGTVDSVTFCPPMHLDELYISTIYQSYTVEADSDSECVDKVFRKVAGHTT